MSKTLRLAPKLAMPPDAVTRTFGIFGQRGTGKSTTGAVLVEQAVKVGGRSVVFDPTGVWWGLTRAGSGPGLPGVVLGGEHADAPLEPLAGGLVAEFVIHSDYPLVVLDMKLLRKHQRQHFAMECLEKLYHDNRDPLLVVLDEAAQFAPTHMREGGDVPRLLGAVEDVVKLGRSRGLGAAMIEQRIATLNANVREQIETLIAHRLVGPLDRKALREWVAAQGEPERESEALALIPKVEPGEALVWSPAFLKFFGTVAMNNAATFDSRATPEVGKKRLAPTERAPVDLDVLKERMAETIEHAKENDPKELRASRDHERALRVRAEEAVREHEAWRHDLEQIDDPDVVEALVHTYMRAREQVGFSADLIDEARALRDRPAEPVEVEVPVLSAEHLLEVTGLANRLQQAILDGQELLGDFARPVNDLGEAIRKVVERTRDQAPTATIRPPAPEPVERVEARREPPERVTPSARAEPRAEAPRPASALPTGSDNGTLGKAERLILAALAQYPEGRTKRQVAILTGYSVKGGGFRNSLTRLRTRGLMEGTDPLRITRVGIETLGPFEALPTGRRLLDHWMGQLGQAHREILQVLAEAWPESLTKEQIAERTESRYAAAGGGFRNALSRLRTLELIEGRSEMKASDDFFQTAVSR